MRIDDFVKSNSGPDSELHLFDGGHFLLDEQVENVAGLIRDFIQRHAP